LIAGVSGPTDSSQVKIATRREVPGCRVYDKLESPNSLEFAANAA
jgi:hypothetical protein